jgi:4-hydroxymandelate oxidase
MAHVAGGAGEEQTLGLNRSAFERLTITPRVLARVEAGGTRLVLPDGERPHPFFLAPVACQRLLRAGGEIETARAAGAVQAGLVLSTLSSFTLEEVAAVAGPDRWFQLYAQPDPAVTRDLVRRAEAAGYRAIVLTVDAPVQPASLRALRAGFVLDETSANLAVYPTPPARQLDAGDSRILQGLMAEAPGWADLDALVAQTSLPVWVKGVMHPDDAAACLARGAAGLIVSNHGGRALDGAPSTLSVLPRVRAAVGAAPILVDGGIRSGTDAFKAIALGADGVLVGRLQAYALAVAGALGVAHLVKLLREELELCMALAGCATLADVRKAEVLGPEGARPC